MYTPFHSKPSVGALPEKASMALDRGRVAQGFGMCVCFVTSTPLNCSG